MPGLHCSHLPPCSEKYVKSNLDKLLLFVVNSQYSGFQAITPYMESVPRIDFPLNYLNWKRMLAHPTIWWLLLSFGSIGSALSLKICGEA